MTSRFPFNHPEIEAVLARLHKASRRDKWALAPNIPRYFWASFRDRLKQGSGQHPMFRNVYSAVTEERGALLYLVARAIRAMRVVEFGSSFGISAIYLATAVRDNAATESNLAAWVVGSEMEPGKCEQATGNLSAAGLAGIATILPGDALETLRAVEAPVDLVFLDGRKDLYLPVLKILKPKLREGAVILSDNIHSFKRDVAPFLAYVQSGTNGFASSTVNISDGMEFSVFQRSMD
ncbi:MAG TPA: class I SAM-dependent methyltransferase [Candidatus Baltobacteraceae bacterium]|jgi:predicted O-methyltransferase YrrM|nr:class I SAM-dependent methyltransferase [Candidatus Baltobacteraceae bacterium]